ncbi:MAG: HD domain-containing phosphohydrolase [Oscillochloridaceae bacterium umkhey_bin13]
MRVLYIEDNALDADLTRRLFERHHPGITLEIATTWREAMQRLLVPSFDLVLTDLNLPDGDGMRILDHIRAQQFAMAVVVITGLDEEAAAVAALQAGADDVVIKRDDYLNRLPATLSDALARSRLLLARQMERIHVLAVGMSNREYEQLSRHLARYAPHISLNPTEAHPTTLEQISRSNINYDVVLIGGEGGPLSGIGTLKLVRHRLGIGLPIIILADPHSADLALQAIRLGADEYIVRQPTYLSGLPAVIEKCYGQIRRERLMRELRMANVGLELAYDSTLEGWARALELRDHETEGHSRRVTDLTMKLVARAGLDEALWPHIRRGALLHDIGKMGVPDNILHKPGPLNDDEWVIMRRHPTYAYEMLSPISFLGPALAIPWCHHERWDGRGYPRGLLGPAIPIEARLFAVVDVWDAVTSPRPYRGALPYDEALAIITSGAGSHFDPYAVELFLDLDLRPYQGPGR